jgi:hypothetical protein
MVAKSSDSNVWLSRRRRDGRTGVAEPCFAQLRVDAPEARQRSALTGAGLWHASVFQVEAPVTRRSPHRPGLEDFPHPVPRFRFFYQTVNHLGDTPSGARLCYPFGIKYCGLSLAGVADRSSEKSQRALYLCDSCGSTIFAKLSPCIRRQPPMPCNCL